MATVIIIQVIIVIIVSLFWVRGIDRAIQYEHDHPNADKNAGWLDWDEQLNSEMEEWNSTLNDGLEDEPEWWGGNNDNPDTNTTGENDTTGKTNTNITDETTNKS